MSKTINAARLRALGACSAQVEMFVSLFGEKDMEPTLVLCVEHAAMFDWGWARCLLSAPARRAYDEATAPAERAYNEARATAERAYNEATATAWRAYNEAMAPARRAYDEATAPAERAYDEARATAWFAAWQNS